MVQSVRNPPPLPPYGPVKAQYKVLRCFKNTVTPSTHSSGENSLNHNRFKHKDTCVCGDDEILLHVLCTSV